ncbi:DUF6114 domain-containing protein [Micromonospora sp. NPDC004551]|uniref:DUF6114 domain-containing protein n=1 Tax=Micromonospora sp. NPDC004551 TaxID=3154284 RepID=UPI0033A4F597
MTAGRHEAPEAAEAAPAAHRPAGRWRRWRRGRPFTAGVLVALGGAEMLVTLRAPLGVLLHVGPQGLAAYLVPVVLVLCGVLLIATPQQRVFYALVTLVLGLVSWLTSNLGGFLVGMLLALVGGALAFAWTPARPPRAARSAPAPRHEETPAGTTETDSAPGLPAQTGPAQAEARVGTPEAAPGDRR